MKRVLPAVDIDTPDWGFGPFRRTTPRAIHIDDDFSERLFDRYQDAGPVVSVRPYRDPGGYGISSLQRAESFLTQMHHVETSWRGITRNVTPPTAFEMAYDAGEELLQFRYASPSADAREKLHRELNAHYRDAEVSELSPTFLPITDGMWLAGARLSLRERFLKPIKNFRDHREWFQERDPYDSITHQMVGDRTAPDTHVLVQMSMKPAFSNASVSRRNWYDGWFYGIDNAKASLGGSEKFNWGALAGSIGDLFRGVGRDVSQMGTGKEHRQRQSRQRGQSGESELDKWTTRSRGDPDGVSTTSIERQRGEKGYHANIRILAVGNDREEAIRRVKRTANAYESFYDTEFQQGFVPEFVSQSELRRLALRAAGRDVDTSQTLRFGTTTWAGVGRIPSVSQQQVDYTLSKSDHGVPPKTPRFDFETYGLIEGTEDEKAAAMLDWTPSDAAATNDDTDDAFWFGLGAKHGVEVGVFSDALRVPSFVVGTTGSGKTTFLTNKCSQSYSRGNGGLDVDPKGKDMDDFLREWLMSQLPEWFDIDDYGGIDDVLNDADELGIPLDDVVIFDFTDDFDKVPQFNFLSIPESIEPGTYEFESYASALADDLAAMVAQAGGSEKYLGALMKRVAKAVVQALARSGRTATFLDVAAACSTTAALTEIADWMNDERIHFVKETVARLAEKEDQDLEPLAGRMDEYILNGLVRDIICAREQSFSIHNAVKEGKRIFVRFPEGAGDTEKSLLTTALIRRTYCAKRMLGDDAPPFELTLDECDKTLTEQSNIHTILSEARGHDYRITLACQAPANQLPEKIAKAVENQCRTFVTYNPGGGSEAAFLEKQHSDVVDDDTLMDLDPFTFYLRTLDWDDKLTDSFMVSAFRPAREIRAETGAYVWDDDELTAFKQRVLERCGAPKKTAEEQAEDILFASFGDDGDTDSSGVEWNADRAHAVLEAVFREEVATGESAVDTAAVIETIGEATDVQNNHRDTLLHRADSRGLVDTSPDGKTTSLTPEGREELFDSGTSGNAGNIGHQAPMAFIARELTALGYHVRIPKQDGTELPDLVAELPLETGGTSVEEAESRREDLRHSHPTPFALSGERDVAVEFEKATLDAPAQIGANLRKAVGADRHCLFVVNEGEGDETSVADRLTRKLEAPALVCEHPPDDVDRQFHHRDVVCMADGEAVVLEGDVTYEWVDIDGRIELRSEGETIATFDGVDAWVNRSADDLPTVTDVDAADGTAVSEPFIPELAFSGSVPGDEAWDIAILPSKDGEELRHYDVDAGETRPLSALGDEDDDRVPDDPEGDNVDDRDIWDDPLFK